MKQSAVEFAEELIKVILYYLDDDELQRIQEVFNEGKEIERQQIIDAYKQGFNNAYFNNPLSKEQYYNETFKK
jgi:hypothetical protein